MRLFLKRKNMFHWNWFKQFIKMFYFDPSQDSVLSLARKLNLDRREQVRIRVPEIPCSLAPRFLISGSEFPLVNISMGGVCLKDMQNIFSNEVGQELVVTMNWLDTTSLVRCRMVAISKHVQRHLCFVDLPPHLSQRIGKMVEAAMPGIKLRPLPILKYSPAQTEALELWTGVGGESLAFYGADDLVAELVTVNLTYKFFQKIPPRVQLNETPTRTRPVKHQELFQALLLLENVERPSYRIVQLIVHLIAQKNLWSQVGIKK